MSQTATTCRSCNSHLIPYGHWGICPSCEPDFTAHITAPLKKPKPVLLGKGIPSPR